MNDPEQGTGSIGVVDYGAGNLRNVLNGLSLIGSPGRLVRGPDDFDGIEQLIFPGVGAFGDSIANLDRQGLRVPLKEWLAADRPFFGICIGYQVLFESSEESPGVEGLGHFAGQVRRFPEGDLKVPHMGWNTVTPRDRRDPIWEGLPETPHLYFVHSYYPEPRDPDIVAACCQYGLEFAAAVRSGNVVACQFHPERSQSAGLRVMKNFLVSSGAVPA